MNARFLCRRELLILCVASLCAGCARITPLHCSNEEICTTPIVVDVIANRNGQRLRNCLLEQLRDIPVPTRERYKLKVTLTETVRAYGAFTTGSMGRRERGYIAAFSLFKSPDWAKPVLSATSKAESTYDTALTSGEVVYTIFNAIDDALLEQVSISVVEHIRTHFLKERT